MNSHEVTGKIQYLYLVGRLYPDNRLDLIAPYLTDDPQNAQEDPESPLIVQLYDAEEQLLLRHRVPVGHYTAPGQIFSELAVRGKVPFPLNTRTVRFYREDILVYEIQVSEGHPEIRLMWEPPEIVTGTQRITWEGSHPEGKSLQYFLRYSFTNGEAWQPAGLPLNDNRQEVNFDEFPGGMQCRIMVVATDGVKTSAAESKSFRVPIKPCRAMILAPENGSSFDADETVWFKGQGYYLEEQRAETEELVWISSQDGEFGRGMAVEARGLSPGLHHITLRAGTEERLGEVSISIVIRADAHQEWVLLS